MEVLGIKFAPLSVPVKRRLETLAALFWITIILGGMIFGWILLLAGVYFSPTLRYPLILYALWIVYDKQAAERATRRNKWVRSWAWWRYFRDYFPVKLIKTAELPPDKNYLLACFPHGVLCSGSFVSFGTDALDFGKLYPGVQPSLVTLLQNIQTPFIRELALWGGTIPSTASSLNYMLGHYEKGKAVALMVGGAQEAFFTKPGVNKIYLKRRKGFVRLAIHNGAPLVPVFAFGETDVYNQIQPKDGSWVKMIQDFYKKHVGVSPIIFNGRGIFQYSYGIVPRRTPIHVVVGEPIDFPQTVNPSDELVNELHATFMRKLQDLFNEHKSKYLQDPTTELIIE